jgi:RNA polymerase sigma-70 factor, ECF subfamily
MDRAREAMNSTDLERFESHRPLMFSIAYRMLGSVTEAEDMLQEAFLRYQNTARNEIISVKAFLSAIVTRLCINRLESAQRQREMYIGTWLPEPILKNHEETIDTVRHVELHESLSMVFLILLEQLTPLERAVFLLRQVFDYEYAEIAELIEKDEGACRQLFSRAKKHISENRPRFQPNPELHREMLEQFLAAINAGKIDGLLQLLSEDVTLWADGGGKARGAILEPLHGRETVARFVIASPRLAMGQLEPRIVSLNGEPALLLRTLGQTRFVVMISVDQTSVREIRVIGNPDKLKGVEE